MFMSLLFYSWGGISFFPVICISILINYFGGYLIGWMDSCGKTSLKKVIYVGTIILNLLLLGYWKYLNFFGQIVSGLTGIKLEIPEIALPIGISFFTFQGLSYVIDVYRKTVPVQRKLINVGLYIAFFPQLIAGPIVRYSDINYQIEGRQHQAVFFVRGIRQFTVGLAKKAILANSLAVNADAIFSIPHSQNTPGVAWIGAISYFFQIYFDFSGYSDMAIGLGKMFGFDIPINFNYPYISESIAEFWRRWHISLGVWLRDYIYIPLGGSRKGKKRKLLNTWIVFGISGLWHGANWTFIVWGFYYALLITLSTLWKDMSDKLHKKCSMKQNFLFYIFKVMRTNFLIIIGLVMFKSNSVGEAVGYLKSMFGLSAVHYAGYTWKWYLTNDNIFILLVALVGIIPWSSRLNSIREKRLNEYTYELLCDMGTLLLLAIAIMYVMTSTYNPFIYFQF